MAHGLLHLVAILDVASHRVLSFRVSHTQAPVFCVDALAEAIARYAVPEIVNTDQGTWLISKAWIEGERVTRCRRSPRGPGVK